MHHLMIIKNYYIYTALAEKIPLFYRLYIQIRIFIEFGSKIHVYL